MPSSNVSFSNQEMIAPRKRYKLGIVDGESDGSGSSFESVGQDEALMLLAAPFTPQSYATPLEVMRRTAWSLIPSIHPSRVLMKPLLDPVGPMVVVTLLVSLLTYTSSKTAPFKYRAIEAVVIIALYMIITSSLTFLLGRLFTGGRYHVSFMQILMLLGYSLIGHLLSLSIPFALYSYQQPPTSLQQGADGDSMSQDGGLGMSSSSYAKDGSDVVFDGHVSVLAEDVDSMAGANLGHIKPNQRGDTAFLVCLLLLTGPATLRVALILLSPIQSPPGRMILGIILCLFHLLLLIILHASFVHPTFHYGAKG